MMPRMLMGKELDDALRVLPEYDPTIRGECDAARLIALQELYRIYLPSQMSREIYSKCYLALLRSLDKKQSIQAIRQMNVNRKIIRQESFESIIGGADSWTIIGPSGIGKSSAVSRSISLLMEKPIIEIENNRIIPCLTIQAPADASLKGLMYEILRKADEILGTNNYSRALQSHATVDILIGNIAQVALNHIGLIIVDEIQNIANSKNGKAIVGVLTQLINNSGISICMVGTPESTVFFDQAMILARRSIGLKYESMLYNVPENIVVCINRTEGKIYEQIKNKKCLTLDCSNNWKMNQKKIINATGECIDSCKNHTHYK